MNYTNMSPLRRQALEYAHAMSVYEMATSIFGQVEDINAMDVDDRPVAKIPKPRMSFRSLPRKIRRKILAYAVCPDLQFACLEERFGGVVCKDCQGGTAGHLHFWDSELRDAMSSVCRTLSTFDRAQLPPESVLDIEWVDATCSHMFAQYQKEKLLRGWKVHDGQVVLDLAEWEWKKQPSRFGTLRDPDLSSSVVKNFRLTSTVRTITSFQQHQPFTIVSIQNTTATHYWSRLLSQHPITMATKPTSYLSLPRELRQQILLQFFNGSLPEVVIRKPCGTETSRTYIHPLPTQADVDARMSCVRSIPTILEDVRVLAEALPEVADEVEWVADIRILATSILHLQEVQVQLRVVPSLRSRKPLHTSTTYAYSNPAEQHDTVTSIMASHSSNQRPTILLSLPRELRHQILIEAIESELEGLYDWRPQLRPSKGESKKSIASDFSDPVRVIHVSGTFPWHWCCRCYKVISGTTTRNIFNNQLLPVYQLVQRLTSVFKHPDLAADISQFVKKYTSVFNAHAKTLDALDHGEVLAPISNWKYRNGKLLTGIIVSPIPGWNGEIGYYNELLNALQASSQPWSQSHIYRVAPSFDSRWTFWDHLDYPLYSLHQIHDSHCLFGDGQVCNCYKMMAVSRYCRKLDRGGKMRPTPISPSLRQRAAIIYGNLGVPSRHDLRHKL
ncbi:hypothetical protein E2P81_ATG05777 [Venturia nashicola]|nr:hypothetical protein E2P81_ATG05777 [Venturia nashicola]